MPLEPSARGKIMLWNDTLAYAMGAAGGGADGAAQGNPLVSFIPIIAMFAIFYFLMIRPQQKKAKLHKEFLGNLKKGDRVVTAGGIFGRISEISGDRISVDVAKEKDKSLIIEIHRSYVSGSAESAGKEDAKA